MKCDDFLSSLETGGLVRRWLARRHAARCPRCAQAAAALEQLKRSLAENAALTRGQRQRWLQAAGEPAMAPAVWFRRPVLAGGMALAAMLLAVVALQLYGPQPKKVTQAPPVENTLIAPPRVTRPDPAQEYARLAGELDAAQRELDALLERAQLLQAGQQATQMIAQFSRW